MRVALVAEYPDAPDSVVGGVQAVVRRLATSMAARPGFDVHAVSVQAGLEGPVAERQEGVTVHRLPATARFGNLTLGREERRRTADAIRRIAPDVAHAHVLGPPALGASEAGVPWVATAHGMQADEGRIEEGWVRRIRSSATVRMERMSLERLRHLIVISPYVRDYFRERLQGVETHAIENPVDERFFTVTGARDPQTLFFSGRLIPRKSVETLLRAAGILARAGVPFRLRIAGGADDAAYGESLRDLAREEGVEESVAFLGSVSPERIAEELGKARVFVQSSRQETASLAVTEAMAAGLAVVATDVGGTRYLVDEPESGILVSPESPDDLARALGEFLAFPDRAAAAGAAGKRIAEGRFRADRVVDRTLDVYRAAVADSQPNTGDNQLDREAVID